MPKHPASIFIMDIQNSSAEGIGEELSAYLEKMVKWIKTWTTEEVIVKHRRGDEVILIANGYSAAYVIAHFISVIWKLRDNPPYFGVSFGDINRELQEIDIETWIHPMIKLAREANESLKKEGADRAQFRFHLNENRYEIQVLINSLLVLRQKIMNEQTDIQRMVFSLYEIFRQQRKISGILSKSPSTISSHFKKGSGEELEMIFANLTAVTNSLQQKEFPDSHQALTELQQSIRNHLQKNISEWYENEEGKGNL
ncbi:hypothetical protein RFW18_07575 [Metabacillus idriensis]|uniref:hypothetical protein n=1 Tax=Metabacillus idriensis TaxID=324768 RepID=UPI002812E8A0|nr:hypothetical protein [Metabacillus idriensis]MDR0137606.1 hypothetical protein [Metabacillus idriensis]